MTAVITGRLRVAMFGNFGTRNLGNEATLEAMLENLRQRAPASVPYIVCSTPVTAADWHRIPALSMQASGQIRAESEDGVRRSWLAARLHNLGRPLRELAGWLEAYRALDRTGLLAVVGTGPLTDHGESLLGLPYEIFKWSLLARLRGARVRFIAVGAGPLHSRAGRWFVRIALRLADYRTFRDDASRQVLEAAGFPARRDEVVPDLAFSLPEALLPDARAGVSPGGRAVVGLGVMDYYGPHRKHHNGEAFHEAYIDKMVRFVLRLREEGYAVRMLIGDMQFDVRVREEILGRLRARGVAVDQRQLIVEEIDSLPELLRQLASVSVVVSPRYHNLLLAIMLGKPVASLSYDPKNDALLESVGLGRFRQLIEDTDVDETFLQVRELLASSEAISAALRQHSARYRQAWQDSYGLVFTLDHAALSASCPAC